jgi:NAD(P)-dependent dehydrogenase (short-subunit alcohol dehydrogenase family)
VSGRETWIVSGGTGALGRAIVDAALADGRRVVVPWIVAVQRESLAAAHRKALADGTLVAIEADVADAAGARAVAEQAGPTDVLVNGVGGFGGGAPVHETDLELWDRMYRMNVRSAAALSRAVVPGMVARRRGTIVCVASQAAIDAPPGIAAYAASKAGVVVLVRSLQQELRPHGIRVNAVVPTTIDTPANRKAMPGADFGAWTPPARIAGVVRWLASDAGATVRGALIPV